MLFRSGMGYAIDGIHIGGDYHWSGPTHQNNEHDIIIQDCIVKNLNGNSYRLPILVRAWVNNIYNIAIQRNTVDSVDTGGILLYPYRTVGGSSGVLGSADSLISIQYNTIKNYGMNTTSHFSGGIVLNGVVKNSIIEHNLIIETDTTVAECTGISIDHPDPNYDYHPDQITVQYKDRKSVV